MRKTISLVLLGALLTTTLLGCQGTASPVPPTLAPTSTATPATKSPINTPTASPTPLPPVPPQVVEHEPAAGAEQDLDAPIMLVFDQPMDQASVEAAFRIEPSAAGTFRWPKDTAMQFVPTGTGLQRGQRYEISLSTEAESQQGLPLQQEMQFAFQAVGFLEVAQTQPVNGTTDVRLDTDILVTFNRPVVPLTTLGQQADLPQPLALTPAVPGRGEWLNTAIFRFTPDEPLAPATTYQGRISGGLVDTMGNELAEDYSWSFTTLSPAVLSTVPDDNAVYVGPGQPITITFNQPVGQAAAEEAFTLAQGGDADSVPGTFLWLDGASLVFTPNTDLERSTEYRATIAAGVPSASGQGTTESAYAWRFTTAPPVAIRSTTPQEGEGDVEPGRGMEVHFAGPMDTDTLSPNLTIIPEPTQVYTYWRDSDTTLNLYFNPEPSSDYTVTFSANLSGRYGEPLGEPISIHFRTRQFDPTIQLQGMGRVGFYSAYTATVAYASHRNVTRLDFALYRLSQNEFMQLSNPQLWQVWEEYAPDAQGLVSSWAIPVESELNAMSQTSTNVNEQTGDLSPGLYYLELRAPEVQQPSRQLLVISNTNLTLKSSQSEALVWATDLATGQVVPSVDVEIYGADSESGIKTLAQGRTDEDGVFRTTFEPHPYWQPLYAFVADEEAVSGVAMNQWNSGISPWEFDIPVELELEPFQVAMYTDRPIYRPGQTVYWKGVIRSSDDLDYGLPTTLVSVTVRIHDAEGKVVYAEPETLSAQGTLWGSLQLDSEAGTGYYSVGTQIGDRFYGTSFQVAEYRRPEFEVTVDSDNNQYIQGDTISVAARATYFFGGPVANAEVSWAVLSRDFYFTWDCGGVKPCPPYQFTDYDLTMDRSGPSYGGAGELISEGTGQTDAQGQFSFEIPADLDQRTTSQVFTLEVTVTDITHQATSSRIERVINRGEFYVGLAPREYVGTVGQAQTVDVVTISPDGIPVPRQELTVIVSEHRWYTVQRKASSGGFYYESEVEDVPVFTTTVTTNGQGEGTVDYVPQTGGTYKISASGQDQRGNEVQSATYQWVSAASFISWRLTNDNRIELIPDKDSYEPGDVAEILVQSPYQDPVQALVTIERGHILKHEVRTLQTNSEILEIPLTGEDAPNVFVSVVIVHGVNQVYPMPSFKLGYAQLPVSTVEQELDIDISYDDRAYRPGDEVTFDLVASDHTGETVAAELSVAVVDKAVLALGGAEQQSLLEVFYGQQGLSIQTAASLVLSVEQIVEQVSAAGKGGGGGAGAEGLTVRSVFPDTALWEPAVTTDADGRTQVTLQLPDTLTTWQLKVKAVTADTQVGEATAEVVSTKELLVSPILPRFFTVGDEAQIGAVIHNSTAEEVTADVSLEATGLNVEDATQSVHISANGRTEVSWPVVVQAIDEASLRFIARGGALADAVQLNLPVYNYITPETVGTSGQLAEAGERLEVIYLPQQVEADQGGLTVAIEPSLAASTVDGLSYLQHYPYECIEQVVSRWLPNLLTYRALTTLHIERTDLEDALQEAVPVGLQRIYVLQHTDGGWGWWTNDPSNPFLTAYVLLGLLEAERSEFAVEQPVMDQAADFLQQSLQAPRDVERPWQYDAQAFVLYVLAEKGDLAASRAVQLYEARDRLDSYGKALLALTLHLVNPEEQTRVDALLSDLASEAETSATGTHWETDDQAAPTMSTGTRSTAIVVAALSRLQPDSSLLPNAVRWLMSVRDQGHWETTQETAWALIGLTDYMAASGELSADYSWRVLLNGTQLAQDDVNAANLDEQQQLEVAIADLLQGQSNRLLIQRGNPVGEQTGKGQLYYTAHLRTFVPVEEVQATSRGIFVARQYSLAGRPGQPIGQASVDDTILVKVTIVAPTDLHYVVLEDPLPAGTEGIDRSLKTVSIVGERPSLGPSDEAQEEEWGWWWFSHTDLRDEKAVLFATYLPQGSYEYTYEVRASVPGRFLVRPTTAYEMYFPEVWGRADGSAFTVTE